MTLTLAVTLVSACVCASLLCRQLRESQSEALDLQQQLKSAEQAIKDQQFKTAVLLAETERLKGKEVRGSLTIWAKGLERHEYGRSKAQLQ